MQRNLLLLLHCSAVLVYIDIYGAKFTSKKAIGLGTNCQGIFSLWIQIIGYKEHCRRVPLLLLKSSLTYINQGDKPAAVSYHSLCTFFLFLPSSL